MAGTRRGRGEGGLHWDDKRQRWIASLTVGYTPAGKRIVRRGSGKTKTEARAKLKQVQQDHDDGLTTSARDITVKDAVEDWLTYGLTGRSASTVTKYRILSHTHISPDLGARKLRDLRAHDVDRWLATKAQLLSTSTVQRLRESLSRAVSRAMSRDLVKRNVVDLCGVPQGRPGRPSKSLTYQQTLAVLDAAHGTPIHAYIVISLVTGARTEELRALTWHHVDLDSTPPTIEVWRSVRETGDTKTRKSRRTLALPKRGADALTAHRHQQDRLHLAAGTTWQDHDLVFTTRHGTRLDAANVRRAFRNAIATAGINPAEWTPRELRHSFVSLLSDNGVNIDQIAELCGHAGTRVTEEVYRHQLRPVLLDGAVAMDRILGLDTTKRDR